MKRGVVMAERAVLYARRGVFFSPRSAPARDRRIDGVSRRWREIWLYTTSRHRRGVPGRVARRGTAGRHREGGELYTHTSKRE